MKVRARGMTLSVVGIGLFKTQGLDEYGTAAVGWLRGAGLKATEGPAEHRGGGSKHSLAHAAMHNTHAKQGTDKSTYHMNNRGATRTTVNTQSFHLNETKKILQK